LLALIQIKPKDGIRLSAEQIETFENIVPEIALSLMASQEQETLREMQNTRTALAERRTVSTFIHDQLGQNLGFLHLKLDQLVENEIIQKDKVVQTDLKRLREVANESYEIVRDILKAIRSETTPNITNLLQEQARSVSRRASFKLDFQTIGKPVPLSSVIQQSVFFTFCEILNNVEKHANANKVDVLIAWNDGILDVSVADDGEGFEPEQTQGDDHFGLQIMKERMAGIKGKILINSGHDSGTVVSISVPIRSLTVDS
jgi:signal transduction histidine kinase